MNRFVVSGDPAHTIGAPSQRAIRFVGRPSAVRWPGLLYREGLNVDLVASSACATGANGRRLASPVRVTLARQLGREVDGAWWPRTACLARELPDLIAALYPSLGGVTDIGVNWSPTEGPPDLDSVQFGGSALMPARVRRHQHLMVLSGRRGRANLLVVPYLTTHSLALMVLRRAAGMPIPTDERTTKAFEIADFIVRVARD